MTHAKDPRPGREDRTMCGRALAGKELSDRPDCADCTLMYDWLKKGGKSKYGKLPENANAISFCPHCGEDISELIKKEAPAPDAPARKQVFNREVTNKEIEAIWGLTPLPAGIRPFGVVTDGTSDIPQAIAAESLDGKMWELCKGEIKLLDLEAPGHPSVTAPPHMCNAVQAPQEVREALGKEKYGSNR